MTSIAQYNPADFQRKTQAKAALAALDTGGGVASIANPYGVDVYITRLILDVTTAATAACTLDAGVAAAATTVADDLIDGVDVNTAVILTDNLVGGGTNGKGVVRWGAAEFLTVSMKTGAAAGLVGFLYFEVSRI